MPVIRRYSPGIDSAFKCRGIGLSCVSSQSFRLARNDTLPDVIERESHTSELSDTLSVPAHCLRHLQIGAPKGVRAQTKQILGSYRRLGARDEI